MTSSNTFEVIRELRQPQRVSATRTIEASERSDLVAWLDDRLRAGQRGRLESEYPVSLNEGTRGSHRVVYEAGAPVAHAMFHLARVRAPRLFCVGMIGLVYTEPEARRRGLARRCIEACVDEIASCGADAALLWSEERDFYARLGFTPFGSEVRYAINPSLCRRARVQLTSNPRSSELRVGEARSRDWACLERLYAAKPIRALRKPGVLRRLASAPETHVAVARRGKKAVAYAAVGRGDDFRGVVHEWAGSPAGVLACLDSLCTQHGPLCWFRGPTPGPVDAALESAGASSSEAPFALARALSPAVSLPESLYLWGFDSI